MSIEHLSICILNLWYNWYNNNWSVLILFLPEIESWTQQTSVRMRTVWCSGRLPEGKQRPMLQWQAEGQNSWLQIRMLFQIGPCRPCIDLHRFLHWFGSFQKLITRISIHNYSHPQLVTTSVLSQVSTAIFQVAPWNASLDSVDMLDLWTHQWASLDQWAKRRSSGCQKSATKNFAAEKMEVFVAKNPLANHLNMSKNILGMDGNGSLPSLIAPQDKPLDTAWRCMEQNKRKTWRIPNTNLYKKHNAQKQCCWCFDNIPTEDPSSLRGNFGSPITQDRTITILLTSWVSLGCDMVRSVLAVSIGSCSIKKHSLVDQFPYLSRWHSLLSKRVPRSLHYMGLFDKRIPLNPVFWNLVFIFFLLGLP